MLEYSGWAGNVFIIAGLILVAYQSRAGFLYGCVGNCLWCLRVQRPDMVTLSAMIIALQIFSWFKWGPRAAARRALPPTIRLDGIK